MQRQKTIYLAIGLFLILAFALSFVSVVAAKKNGNNVNTTRGQTKMTYGRCVANLTIGKNSCFKQAQQAYKECRFGVKELAKNSSNATNVTELNKTQIRDMLRDCRNTYKEQILSCKTTFKQEKSLCGQYKCKENEAFINNTCMKQEPEEPINETGESED